MDTEQAKTPDTSKPPDNSKSPKVIYFTLSENRVIWKTPDGKIALNRFMGQISGSVTKDEDPNNYNRVLFALDNKDLVNTDKAMVNKIAKAEHAIDLTNLAENKQKAHQQAIKYLQVMKKDELLAEIGRIKNPNVLVSMIEQESRGKNISKRKRDDVIETLKAAFDTVAKTCPDSVMFSYLEDTDKGYKVKQYTKI